jgi:hypothetical protein
MRPNRSALLLLLRQRVDLVSEGEGAVRDLKDSGSSVADAP